MDPEYYKEMADNQMQHWWYEGRRHILRSFIARLSLPKNTTILEAGCGPGANLNMLKNFGDVHAFEPDEFAISHASALSNIDVQKGGLPEPFPFQDQKYDLIGAFDVIEHIEDDLGALKKLYAHTKLGGYGLFTVPAHQWLWSHHDEINDHKRRYSKQSFKTVLEQSGYEIVKISYYNMWLFPLALLVRGIKKTKGAQSESDVEMPSPLVNRILRIIFGSERYLLKFASLPMGLSVIAICKKSKE